MDTSLYDHRIPTAWRGRARPMRMHPVEALPPALHEWLRPSRDALFRWVMSMAVCDEGRRAIAETAVAVQRLQGGDALHRWLYATALQAAAAHAPEGLPERSLSGLAPELRALLRLVSRGVLRREEAMALFGQPIDRVRSRLVQTRLALQTAPAEAGAELDRLMIQELIE